MRATFSASCAPKYAVFSGGGQRGLAYLGALSALQQVHGIDLAKGLAGAAGASIGALFALFMVLKLSPRQADKEIRGLGFRDICTLNPGLLYRSYGMDGTEQMRSRLDDLLKRFTGLHKPTLAQLFAHTGRELICVATDVVGSVPYYLSARTEPDMDVSRAVAVSMSIPLLFCPFVHRGKVLVDGGLTDCFPMGCFPVDQTLGFFVKWSVASGVMDSMERYIARTAYTLAAQVCDAKLERLSAKDRMHVIMIDVGDVKTVSLTVDEAERAMIQEAGRQALHQSKLFVERPVVPVLFPAPTASCPAEDQAGSETTLGGRPPAFTLTERTADLSGGEVAADAARSMRAESGGNQPEVEPLQLDTLTTPA